MKENQEAGKIGGNIAKKARLELESKTGQKVVTGSNYLAGKKQKAIKALQDEEVS